MDGSQQVFTVADPSIIREITIKYFNTFRNRRDNFDDNSLLSKAVAFERDDKWKSTRSILSPLFTMKQIKKMLPYVEQCCDNTIEHISCHTNEDITLLNEMGLFTLSMIAKCAFGVSVNGHKNPNDEFVKHARNFVNFKPWRLFTSKVVPSAMQENLNIGLFDINDTNYIRRVFESVIKQRMVLKEKQFDFLNSLLDSQQCDQQTDDKYDLKFSDGKAVKQEGKGYLTNDEILAQCLILLAVGHDTTAITLTYTLYALAMNTKIQEKLFNEIRNFMEKKESIDFDELNSLQYLDAVMNESMRMYPAVTSANRIAMDDCRLGDSRFAIEKGTAIDLAIYALHHDSSFFPEPNSFKPERFLPENRHTIQPYTFIPFGVGHRNCLGMRLASLVPKVFLVKLLNQFEVVKTRKTVEKPIFKMSFAALASEPLIVSFARRSTVTNPST